MPSSWTISRALVGLAANSVSYVMASMSCPTADRCVPSLDRLGRNVSVQSSSPMERKAYLLTLDARTLGYVLLRMEFKKAGISDVARFIVWRTSVAESSRSQCKLQVSHRGLRQKIDPFNVTSGSF